MKAALLEPESLFVSAETSEVLRRHGDHVCPEENDDSADGMAPDSDVEENGGIRSLFRRRSLRVVSRFRLGGALLSSSW